MDIPRLSGKKIAVSSTITAPSFDSNSAVTAAFYL